MPPDPSHADAELLGRARSGDQEAVATLYADHVGAARKLAVILAGAGTAEDLVADAFARVFEAIGAGAGPETNFRGYLFVTIRNRHRDLVRRSGRESPASDQPWLLEGRSESLEEQVQELGQGAAVSALGRLPDSWQQVLWHLEVEGHRVPEVASMLSMTPAAVSSLAYRAREGLKVAYLDNHLPSGPGDGQCAWTRQRLSAYVRGGLSPRASRKLDLHLRGCAACATAAADLQHVNRKFAALILPVLLLGAAGGGFAALEAPEGASPPAAPGPSAGASARGASLSRASAGGSRSSRLARAVRRPGGVGLAGALRAAGSRTLGGNALVAFAAVVATALVVGVCFVAWSLAVDATDSTTSAAGEDRSAAPDSATPSPSSAPPSWGTAVPPFYGPVRPTDAPIREPAAAAPTTSPTISPSRTKLKQVSAPVAPPVKARPVAPTATNIGACDSYGSLVMAQTTGIDYVLSEGDGQQGAWVVTGKAQTGYLIPDGAQRKFSGDLGTFYACPALGTLALTDLGDNGSGLNNWRLDVPVTAGGTSAYRIVVRLTLNGQISIPAGGVTSAGWACWGPTGEAGPQVGTGTHFTFSDGDQVQCFFEYTGAAPSPLAITFEEGVPGVPAAGIVDLLADGTTYDSATY